jgi:DNA-binding protein HU-beta
MNKQEFVESLAERCDLSKAEAGRALDAILDSLTEAMSGGEDVRFTGFGTFSSQRRRAREGVNPQDPSQKIRIRAAHVPKFKPGTSLREAVSEAPTGERPEVDEQREEEESPEDAESSVPVRESSAPVSERAAATPPGEPLDWVPLGLRK